MSREQLELFKAILSETYMNSRLSESKKFIQHGDTSIYDHSVSVAYNSYRLARFLGIRVDEKSLIRGALLHDYFLYDWHMHDGGTHRWHGFRHPGKALNNAVKEFELSDVEMDLIKRHMFPLTPVPPRHREGLLVCLVDKACSISETFGWSMFRYVY